MEEDLNFYEDQKKERKMILRALDTSYLARTQARDERKIKAETITSESLPALSWNQKERSLPALSWNQKERSPARLQMAETSI